MKRVADPTQPVITFFFALFIAVTLTIAGCSANTISGPDVAPSEELTEDMILPAPGPNASHNEGEDAGKKGKGGSNSGNGGNGNTHNSNGGDHND